MTKIFSYTLILLTGLVLVACKKDLGNYSYKAINDISFSNIDTVNMYEIFLGDTLHIAPVVSGSIDKGLSGEYSYTWKILDAGGRLRPDSIIATGPTLNLLINLLPNIYSFSFGVTDKVTGVTWLKRVSVTVITPYYEGWLVLSRVKGASRLDFMSYLDNTFTFKKDVLTKLNSGVPRSAEPTQVLYNNLRSADPLKGIFFSTALGTSLLDGENYSYSPELTIPGPKFMNGNVPADFRVEKLLYARADNNYNDNILLYSGGDFYKQSYGFFSYGLPLNTDVATGLRFKAAPYFAGSGDFGAKFVVYDVDDRKFMSFYKQDVVFYSQSSDMDSSLHFPTGKDLLYMTDNDVPSTQATNFAYAVLKDPGVNTFYMVRWSFANNKIQPVNYNEEITATDFALAEHYAISPDLGYLFYNVGGKIYEYDLFLKTSKVVADKGNETISLLVFDTNNKNNAWSKFLTVGSYDPGGIAGENGSLTNYQVPPVNGPLVEQQKWSGFGEIVSVSYRYR